MAQKIDHEGSAQRIINPFAGQQIPNVEQIAWVLAIKSGDELPAIEVGKRNHFGFREAESVFDRWRDGAKFRVIDTAAQNRRYLDLDLHVIGPDEKARHRARTSPLRDLRTTDTGLNVRGDPLHCSVDRRERLGSPGNREIRQIDVDRKARHIANEQVDRRAALEGEAVFRRDVGHGANEQSCLPAIGFSERHSYPPEPLSA